MKIQKAVCYVGPNRIAPVSLAHLQVLIEDAQAWPTDDTGHACTDRLLALLPGLASHPDVHGQAGNFVRALHEGHGAPICFVAARVAAELLHLHHGEVRPAGITARPDGRTTDIFFGYRDPDIALLAGRTAINIVLALLPPESRPVSRLPATFQLDAAIPSFVRISGRIALDQKPSPTLRRSFRPGSSGTRLRPIACSRRFTCRCRAKPVSSTRKRPFEPQERSAFPLSSSRWIHRRVSGSPRS